MSRTLPDATRGRSASAVTGRRLDHVGAPARAERADLAEFLLSGPDLGLLGLERRRQLPRLPSCKGELPRRAARRYPHALERKQRVLGEHVVVAVVVHDVGLVHVSDSCHQQIDRLDAVRDAARAREIRLR